MAREKGGKRGDDRDGGGGDGGGGDGGRGCMHLDDVLILEVEIASHIY